MCRTRREIGTSKATSSCHIVYLSRAFADVNSYQQSGCSFLRRAVHSQASTPAFEICQALNVFSNPRPETVESLFLAYRLTGNQKYRDYGWQIFQAIEKSCKVDEGGYTSILNVDDANSERLDKMETFFLVCPV